ncbi:hypothetical protein EYF80_065560 [Liparis tanakae]|uniref:Uncharacterized protein n=1 Tax=Liparis tanakae TaxID=230148 RepID=A0A4Z2E6E0_9TELE|nr:hypothetical protein EYF80_065560 [Liparis tanakae]
MLPGGWFGIRRAGLGPPGYRGDMKGCGKGREKDITMTFFQDRSGEERPFELLPDRHFLLEYHI